MDIGFAVLCGAGRGLAWPAALQVFMFYAARADLAKQRRQLAEMPQWQLRDIGIDPIAAKAEAEKSSWGAEPPWQKPQWANPQWKKQQWKKRQGQKLKRDRLVWRSFAWR